MDEHQKHEHEVYGAEIPDVGDMEGDEEMPFSDGDNPSSKEESLEDMKKRLKEIEEEASALREMQTRVEKEMGVVQEDSSGAAATQVEKEEVDSRSIYVGNVDYACTPEEVQQHFQSCGTVNRVTILTDKFGQPKGFAYVEFVEIEAVQNALLLNESELHGRQLKVSAKRTNIPGMKQYRGWRPNPYMAFQSRRPFLPPPYHASYGYGYMINLSKSRSTSTLPDHHIICPFSLLPSCSVHLLYLLPFPSILLLKNEIRIWTAHTTKKSSKAQAPNAISAILINHSSAVVSLMDAFCLFMIHPGLKFIVINFCY